eukprot:jgi/Mesen1/3613/ME000020S03139
MCVRACPALLFCALHALLVQATSVFGFKAYDYDDDNSSGDDVGGVFNKEEEAEEEENKEELPEEAGRAANVLGLAYGPEESDDEDNDSDGDGNDNDDREHDGEEEGDREAGGGRKGGGQRVPPVGPPGDAAGGKEAPHSSRAPAEGRRHLAGGSVDALRTFAESSSVGTRHPHTGEQDHHREVEEEKEDGGEEGEAVVRWRKDQRFAAPGEPACVTCGRFGAYVCDQTDADICSVECKEEHLQSTAAAASGAALPRSGQPAVPAQVRSCSPAPL